MQVSPSSVAEREARHRLPYVLVTLLDDPELTVSVADGNSVADFVATDRYGRRWLMEVKGSSRPGQVAQAAQQLRGLAADGVIPVLVVPFMSRAGADAAERQGLNWLDLSGNARIRASGVFVNVQGRPDELPRRGRPASPFAPRSARVTRTMLRDPEIWWTQKDLAEVTGLNDGSISRIVRRLDEELLITRNGRHLRPSDPGLLLDAWAQDYNFTGHDVLPCHVSGSGAELAAHLAERLQALAIRHAFTGLPAAWAMDHFARFRLVSVYVAGDPRDAAKRLEVRQGIRGANVQLIGPNDDGVFSGDKEWEGIRCVSPAQVYVDLLNLPERASDAAQHLRTQHMRWRYGNPSR